jgi:ribosomal protein S18 acetylase RimI-like enzyme
MQEIRMTKVRQAGIGDLDALVPLFDAYRQFYKRETDPSAAREFLLQRFQHQQSVIFIAHDDEGAAIGFTQLYPLFSSLTLARTFVLYDLFVAPSARRSGAARKLLRAAAGYGRAVGAGALELSTATDNVAAQRLYESDGWVRDTAFYVYSLGL